jgi:hypothetical protein
VVPARALIDEDVSMRRLTKLGLTFFVLVLIACDGGMTGGDGGRDRDAGDDDMDGGRRRDGGGQTDEDAGGGDPDGGSEECDEDQHLCDGTCTDAMPADPSNGCQLGCGDPCPGGEEAICESDGNCGIRGCTPMSCDDLGIMCGVADNGCGRRIGCGMCDAPAECVEGQCEIVCDTDPHEANETRGTATNLGSREEDDDPAVVANATIHSESDVDWFRLTAVNECCGGDPEVDVRLNGLPSGEDYDLLVLHDCPDDDGERPGCTTGTPTTVDGLPGCYANAVGDDTVSYLSECEDGGTIYVQVYPAGWSGSCDAYRLEIEVY